MKGWALSDGKVLHGTSLYGSDSGRDFLSLVAKLKGRARDSILSSSGDKCYETKECHIDIIHE